MKYIFAALLLSILYCFTTNTMQNFQFDLKIKQKPYIPRKSKYTIRCCPYCFKRFPLEKYFKDHLTEHDEVKRLQALVTHNALPRTSTSNEKENKMKALVHVINNELKQFKN